MDKKIAICADGIHRSGLAIARALNETGNFTITFILSRNRFSDSVKRIIDFHSINRIDFAGVTVSDSAFPGRLVEIATRNNTDIILPVGSAAVLISKIKPELEKICTVLVEDYEKLLLFHDKSRTLSIAKDLDVPHPATWLPENSDEVEILADKIKYPAVIKPRKGTAADGVWYAKDRSELIRLYQRATSKKNAGDGLIRDSSTPMIQEYVSGELHDVAAFCIDGEMKLGLTQKRLMTRPLSGGMGIVNVTTKKEQLLHYAEKIIDRVKWNGVMLMDFKIDDRNGEPKLLEVNPRFWGTTWLTIQAGYNYPYYLVQNTYGVKIDFPADYRVGLYCRWPMQELFTIFEKPVSVKVVLDRFGGFVSRFKLKNCMYQLL
jgi:predicted ATP-grasp superfamily ATP-dependent carboligase